MQACKKNGSMATCTTSYRYLFIYHINMCTHHVGRGMHVDRYWLHTHIYTYTYIYMHTHMYTYNTYIHTYIHIMRETCTHTFCACMQPYENSPWFMGVGEFCMFRWTAVMLQACMVCIYACNIPIIHSTYNACMHVWWRGLGNQHTCMHSLPPIPLQKIYTYKIYE